MKNKMKKAQITIFIILALILIVSIALIFVFIKNKAIISGKSEDPNAYMEQCLVNSLTNNEKEFLDKNGYLNKTDNYILYQNEKVYYLCKASKFYSPCINQEPLFLEHIKMDFEKIVGQDAKVCFNDLIKNLKKKGYDIKENDSNFKVNLKIYEDNIQVDLNKKVIISKGDEKKVYNYFTAKIPSPLYSLASLTEKIVNFESTLCEFNNINWMKVYPGTIISRFVTSDQTKVYTLTEEKSQKEIKFAIKTCVLPAGI